MLWNVATALTCWKYHLFLEELSSCDPIKKTGSYKWNFDTNANEQIAHVKKIYNKNIDTHYCGVYTLLCFSFEWICYWLNQ